MNLFNIAHIAIKFLKGQTSEKENVWLEEWKKEQAEHEALLRDMENEKILNRDLIQYNKYNADKAWYRFEENKLHARSNSSLLLPLIKIAAVLLLIVSIGGVLYVMMPDMIIQHASTNAIVEPGDRNAILYVADHGEINLSDSANATLQKESKVLARVKQGQIQYGGTSVEPLQMLVEVPLRCEYQFKLSDGTQVWMNAGSKVRFEHPFEGDIRSIYAEGEVFLKVAKDKDKPFIVNLPNDNSIRVLGTEFNIKAYPEEEVHQSVLVEGSVSWRTSKGTERIMEPNQLLSMNNSNNDIKVQSVDVYPYIAWTQGRFVFDGATLNEITLALSRWYGMDFIYQDDSIKELHFTVDVRRYEHLNDILNMLEVTEKVIFKIDGSKILVTKHK